jgi:hypothetical protein
MAERGAYLVARFRDADGLLAAVHAARDEGLTIHDVYAPCPVHGLDEAMGLRRTRLPFVTLLAGLGGLGFALCFQLYTNILDWPLDVGGKPANSALAFVPVCFELTVLIGGLSTVGAFFLRARLFPGKTAGLVTPGVTDDVFALVVRKPDEVGLARVVRALLIGAGADEIEEREAELAREGRA